jgi:GT2 family glycosyltransferase
MKRNIKKTLTITVNWNDSKRTLRCIKSLINCNYSLFDILIVDNNSLEKNYKKLKTNIKKIKKRFIFKEIKKINYKKKLISDGRQYIYLLKIPFNSGCTGGYNLGYYFGKKSNYKYLSRIDNDCTVDKNYLKQKVVFLDNNVQYVGINSKVCYLQKKNYIQWVGAKFGFNLIFHRSIRIFEKTKLDQPQSKNLEKNWKGLIKTDTLNGPGSLIRSNVFNKTKFSNIDFFFGPEDIELSQRLKKLGKIGVYLDSKIFHEVARSSVLTGKFKRTYYEYKSQLLLVDKIYPKYLSFLSQIYFLLNLFLHMLLIIVYPTKLIRFKTKVKILALKDFYLNKLGIYDLKNENIENKNKKEINKYIAIFSKKK